MTTEISKKPKLEPENPDDVEEDRISRLPEDILHMILSSLETREVIKTSLLSTRWRNLWKSHPFINFSKFSVYNHSKTLIYVDHVLRLRDSNASNIQNLTLECWDVSDLEFFQQCIVSAVNQGAEMVDIMVWSSRSKSSIELNPSIFTSGVVRVFKFAEFHNLSNIKFPRSICYATHLRFLKLYGITLPQGDSNQELHLICPNLEKLIIKDCDHSHLRVLDISVPQLNKLGIFNCPVANASVGGCKLEIHTPNLSSFRYNGCSYLDYSFMENFPFLDSVDVTLNLVADRVKRSEEDLLQSIIKLLNGFSNAKNLTLKGIVGIFSRVSYTLLIDKEIRHFTPFTNLKNLKLRSTHEMSSIQGIVYLLLNSCGLVESFEWQVCKCTCTGVKEYLMIPEFNLCCLKFVKVRALHGHRNELEFLKFLAKSAVVLEEMNITIFRDSFISLEEVENQRQFIEALTELSWSSPSAKLSLELL